MATAAVKIGNPGASLTEVKKEMAEKTGQPLCSILNEDNKEKTVEEEGHYSGLLEVLNFDELLLNDMKSGIVPFVEESPSITIYRVPDTIRRVDEQAYITRYRSLAIHFSFNRLYPRDLFLLCTSSNFLIFPYFFSLDFSA
ncbi:hypothetical protein H6P81_016949 [Aristolochia fimbriata]|uniref:Uncharacterized protein n=1 Tax=Aristolochia fimbriata TaxID=158543 RepID=A0AAV7DWR9_ARIFI|nr:hypothetical protein H6P81_016949 [Aristolochia fimbriata]